MHQEWSSSNNFGKILKEPIAEPLPQTRDVDGSINIIKKRNERVGICDGLLGLWYCVT